MADEEIVVSLHLFESGQLKAFADVTLHTSLGEITIKGFRVVQILAISRGSHSRAPRTKKTARPNRKIFSICCRHSSASWRMPSLAAFKRMSQND
jgi:hypothetical protein